MKQKTLTDNPPMILDATCSFSRIWPKHATIRMDIRPIVKPDIVGDIKKTDFPSSYFDEIYMDPPHMIRKDDMIMPHDIMYIRRRLSGRRSPGDITRYGVFRSRDEWLNFVNQTNLEIFRILKPNGLLHTKWTFAIDKRYIKREDLNGYTNFQIIEEKITKSKKPGSKNKVHWITFKPKGLHSISSKVSKN